MAYKRRTSPIAQAAQTRAASLKAIDPALDLGNGLSLAAFHEKIARTQAIMSTYNTRLAEADALLNDLKVEEKDLASFHSRILEGVGAHYGKDSSEYEQAGGTRTSEIRRKPRQRKTVQANH